MELCEQAARASLGERVTLALNGLFGQLDGLAAMVRWRHLEAGRQVATLPLPAAERAWVGAALLPALHVRRRLSLARDATEQESLLAQRDAMRARVEGATSPRVAGRRVSVVACRSRRRCVPLFPRPTSMLEGHNAQDALRRHLRHAISGAFRGAAGSAQLRRRARRQRRREAPLRARARRPDRVPLRARRTTGPRAPYEAVCATTRARTDRMIHVVGPRWDARGGQARGSARGRPAPRDGSPLAADARSACDPLDLPFT